VSKEKRDTRTSMVITGKQVFTTLADGKLTVELAQTEFAQPTGNQVLIKMEAAPINPSDLALLTAGVDLENAEYTPGRFVATMPEPIYRAQKERHGLRLPVGNEGAGVVVAAGESKAAQALLGQRVAAVPGSAYSQYCYANADWCFPLGDISSVDGASVYVNPMTALGFVETARMEGHSAIINNAAASNLGQMLVRICAEDDIQLVNIVRKAEHVELLKKCGAKHIVNTSDKDFFKQLCDAIDATGASLGFDPVGGGSMIDTCFRAMEQVAKKKTSEYSRYGSLAAKKMYLYGFLDPGTTTLNGLACGFGWTLTTWQLFMFEQTAGREIVQRMRKRVLEGLTSTFASSYKREVSLEDMLSRDAVLDYRAMKTGEKYLVLPQA
jgi:NADPH:quinone reductase-like Zn-dependent oxidoreductase